MNESDHKRELERLAARLERIERYLGIPPLPEQALESEKPHEKSQEEARPEAPSPKSSGTRSPPVIPPLISTHREEAPSPDEPSGAAEGPPTVAIEPAVPPSRSEPEEEVAAPPVLSEKAAAFRRLHEAHRGEDATAPAPSVWGEVPPQPAERSLEFLIGGKLFAWIGAIAAIATTAFFAKLAYDEGWIGKVSPLLRFLLMLGASVVMMAGGEWAFRRIGKAASAGLFGGGIGIAYVAALAALWPLAIVNELGALMLLLVVAAAAFCLTLRTRFLTIGVLSIVGGYLSPWFLLFHGAQMPTALAMYSTMLLGVSLALSAFLPRPFRSLRYVALGGQAILGLWAIVLLERPIGGLAFITLWWAMVQAEAVCAALRRQSAIGNAVASLLATGWYVIFGCVLLRDPGIGGGQWTGAFALAVGLAAAAIALTFGPALDALRQVPRNAIDKLAVALLCSAGILIAAAIALQFDGYGQTIGWLAVGLGSIEAGRHIRSRGLDIFGLIVVGLAVARLLLLDWWLGSLSGTLWTAGADHGIIITGWTMLGLAATAAVHAAAQRVRIADSAGWRALATVLAFIGTVLWMIVCVQAGRGLAVTAGWLIGCAALLAAERRGRAQRYFEISTVVLIITAGRWLIVDAAVARLQRGWNADAALPLLNWQMAMAAAIAGVGVWSAFVLRRRMAESDEARAAVWPVPVQILAICLSVFILIGLSFEIDRLVEQARQGAAAFGWPVGQVKHLLLTLLWGIGALAMTALAWMSKPSGSRGIRIGSSLIARFAWGLLAACAAKWVVVDTFLLGMRAAENRLAALPVANLQMVVGAALAGAGFAMFVIGGLRAANADDRARDDGAARLAQWMPVGACVLILWGLSFELERAIAQWERSRPDEWVAIWPQLQLRSLWWTALWGAGGFVMAAYGSKRPHQALAAGGWAILLLASIAWLTIDTLQWRFVSGPAATTIASNLQFAIGAGLLILLAVCLRLRGARIQPSPEDRFAPLLGQVPPVALALIGLIGLWLGSLEIDRAISLYQQRLALVKSEIVGAFPARSARHSRVR